MAFDDVILRLGEFGRYQRRIYFLLCIPVIVCAFHQIGTSFLGLTVSTRCLLPHETVEDATYNMSIDLMNKIYIVNNKSGLVQACKIRPILSIGEYIPTSNSTEKYPKTKSCEKFIYDKSVFESTTSTEWDLVCDRAWLKTVGDSLFMVGVVIGAVFFGAMSDKFGRKPTLFVSLFVQLVSGLLVTVAPNYSLYIITRMIVGSTCSGVLVVTFIMAVELVGPTKRGIAGVCYQFFWNSGYIGVCGFAYLFPSWRKLQLAISLPNFAFIIFWWLIPESVRWMITNGRGEEAKDLLQQASKVNKKEICRDTLDCLLKEDLEETEGCALESTPLLDLFRYPNLRKRIILLSINWYVIGVTYFGLSWNAVTLGGDFYINHLTSGLVEIPATMFLVWSFVRWGRKFILSGALFLVGAVLIPTVFIPDDCPIANIILFMIGKTGISLCYSTIFVFTAEQIPTIVRNVGLGIGCTCAKIGGITAPFINNLSDIWPPLPLIAFGMMALFCSAVTTLLPETMGEQLPDSFEEGEMYTEIKRTRSIQMKSRARKMETR